MGQVEVRAALSDEEVDLVRGLMREYGAYLAGTSSGAATICIGGLERELAGLPGAYVAPGGLLLGWVDGAAVGCVGLRSLPRGGDDVPEPGGRLAEDSLALEVKRLWVRPEARGVGLGRRLMEHAVEHARAVGARRVYLDTVPLAMPEANALYAAMGFQSVPRYSDTPVSGVEFFSLDLRVPAVRDEPREVTHEPNHTN